MRQILIVACSAFLALILIDNYQVVKAPSGLAVKAGQAFAADLGHRHRLRPSCKGKAPLAKSRGDVQTLEQTPRKIEPVYKSFAHAALFWVGQSRSRF